MTNKAPVMKPATKREGTHYYASEYNPEVEAAHTRDEFTKSEWTKRDMLYIIEDYGYDTHLLKLVKKEYFMKKLLVRTIHTHNKYYYREINYYRINFELLDTLTDEMVQEWILESRRAPEPEPEPKELWECQYLNRIGTNKPTKNDVIVEIGYIKGEWFYPVSGRKRSVVAKGFKILRRVTPAESFQEAA